jgi:hypothetical protein
LAIAFSNLLCRWFRHIEQHQSNDDFTLIIVGMLLRLIFLDTFSKWDAPLAGGMATERRLKKPPGCHPSAGNAAACQPFLRSFSWELTGNKVPEFSPRTNVSFLLRSGSKRHERA